MACFGKWEWGYEKELLLERYSYMHSEKSRLVPNVTAIATETFSLLFY